MHMQQGMNIGRQKMHIIIIIVGIIGNPHKLKFIDDVQSFVTFTVIYISCENESYQSKEFNQISILTDTFTILPREQFLVPYV